MFKCRETRARIKAIMVYPCFPDLIASHTLSIFTILGEDMLPNVIKQVFFILFWGDAFASAVKQIDYEFSDDLNAALSLLKQAFSLLLHWTQRTLM